MENLASLQSFGKDLYTVFIEGDRYKLFLNGLGVTLQLSVFGVLIGIIGGLLLALMRLSKSRVLKSVSGIYIDIMRGTPMVVQLLIFYFVVFGGVRNLNLFWIWKIEGTALKICIGAISFGCNSAAYVAEIIRAGIQSIDYGQTEAGRSLGLSQWATMKLIILPQAIKNVIPALGNELIVLIKETSIFGYIGGVDLTKVGEQIRAKTFIAIVPLVAVAFIYYVVVKLLTLGLQQVERRLRESDIR